MAFSSLTRGTYCIEEPCATLREQQEPEIKDRFDYLILPLGTSYQPLVMSIVATCPKRVLILCTARSTKLLEKVMQFTGLEQSQMEKREVDAQDPVSIYHAIRETYALWGYPGKIAVDFTGGTKAMSGGSAMAGAVIGAELIYIANRNYLVEFRCPDPGSEYLEFIQNPYTVFGDLEEERALDLMTRNDFATAQHILADLAKHVPDPRRYHILMAIAAAYEAWDNFNLEVAAGEINQALQLIKQYSRMAKSMPFSDQDSLDLLKRQVEIINILHDGFNDTNKKKEILELLSDKYKAHALMFSIYHNALRREQQAKYDMGVLLLYRLLELISQYRLALRDLDTSYPDYHLVSEEYPDLAADFEKISSSISDKSAQKQLPSPVSLLQGYILLSAIGDPLCQDLNLKEIRGQVHARDFGVFAHGFIFTSAQDFRKFHTLVLRIFQRCIELDGEDFNAESQGYQFLDFVNQPGRLKISKGNSIILK